MSLRESLAYGAWVAGSVVLVRAVRRSRERDEELHRLKWRVNGLKSDGDRLRARLDAHLARAKNCDGADADHEVGGDKHR